MGLFDIFDDANKQIQKDVSKAWNELWGNGSGNDGDTGKNSTGVNEILSLLEKLGGSLIAGPGRLGSPIENPLTKSLIENLLADNKVCSKPQPGTPVYCDLALIAEHTGIYIGNNRIVHLSGNGNIEIVSPIEFVGRLDGLNPAISIYFATYGNKALENQTVADRARSMVGNRRNYSVLFDNCHQFTCGCISGDFENSCNFFWMVEAEIQKKWEGLVWKNWLYWNNL